jgi:hypothetical protein
MYVGGILYRLVFDNFVNMVTESLTDLDWFSDNRGHKPLKIYPEPIDENTAFDSNAMSISMEDIMETEAEMGSMLSEHSFSIYIDVYGENNVVAMHLASDIKEILQGRFTSIGRDNPVFDVYDLSQATPEFLFYCEIEEVELDRSRFHSKPYEKYWWVVSCIITYTYNNDAEDYLT